MGTTNKKDSAVRIRILALRYHREPAAEKPLFEFLPAERNDRVNIALAGNCLIEHNRAD